jgi:hypothetical protein
MCPHWISTAARVMVAVLRVIALHDLDSASDDSVYTRHFLLCDIIKEPRFLFNFMF